MTSENTAKNLDELKHAFQSFKAIFYPKLECQGKDLVRIESDLKNLNKSFDAHLIEHTKQDQKSTNNWMKTLQTVGIIISLLGVLGLYLK